MSGKLRLSSCPQGPSASAASTSVTRVWWSTTATRRRWPGGHCYTSCTHSWSCTSGEAGPRACALVKASSGVSPCIQAWWMAAPPTHVLPDGWSFKHQQRCRTGWSNVEIADTSPGISGLLPGSPCLPMSDHDCSTQSARCTSPTHMPTRRNMPCHTPIPSDDIFF